MKRANTTTYRMVKKLAAITNKPYGIWIAALSGGAASITLSKLDQVNFDEGARLSVKGIEAVTKVIKTFSANDQAEVNAVIEKIVVDWEKANKANEDAHTT